MPSHGSGHVGHSGGLAAGEVHTRRLSLVQDGYILLGGTDEARNPLANITMRMGIFESGGPVRFQRWSGTAWVDVPFTINANVLVADEALQVGDEDDTVQAAWQIDRIGPVLRIKKWDGMGWVTKMSVQ